MANVELLVPQNLRRLPGTSSEGHKYEYYLAALFGVKAALSNDVENMWLATNVDGLGKFDDLVLFLKKQDTYEIYLIQTKYKQNGNINLSSSKNNLQKFQATYVKIKNDFSNGSSSLQGACEFKKIKFVLYTSHNFTFKGTSTQFQQGDYPNNAKNTSHDVTYKGTSTHFQLCDYPNDAINTGKIFRIPYPKCNYDEDFLNQTLFYSNQIKINQIKKLIREETKRFKNCDVEKIISFFEKWHNGDLDRLVLTKQTIMSILLEVTLSSYIPLLSTKPFSKAHIWNEITKHFKIISVREEKYLPYIWSAVQLQMNKILDKNNIKLEWYEIIQEPEKMIEPVKHFLKWYPLRIHKDSFSVMELYILLWQECSLPLVLSLDHNSSKDVCKILSELESVNSKRRYICFEPVASDFPQNFTIFKSLNIDQSISEIALKNINMSLQGRKSITLEELKPNEPALNKITPDVFIELLQNEVKEDTDDPTYVPRKLKQPIVSIEVLNLQNAVFVIVTDQKYYMNYKTLAKFRTVKPWYLYKLCGSQFSQAARIKSFPSNSVHIIVKRCIDTFKKYKEIEDAIKDVRGCQDQTTHFFKLINHEELEWLYSNRNANTIEPYLLNSNPNRYLQDANLFDYLTFNVLSANAGEGKSTLLQFLSNRCPTHIWVVKLNIGEIKEYIAKGEFSTIIRHLFDNSKDSSLSSEQEEFSWELFQSLLDELNILVVIDGLDESEYDLNMIKFLNEIKALGIKTLIATRPSLKESLEDKFQTSSLYLVPLTSEECQQLVQRSIHDNYDMSQIKDVVEILAKWDNVVGIPLMLKLLVSLLHSRTPLDFSGLDITYLFETYINEQLIKVGKCNKSTLRTLSRSAFFIFFSKDVIRTLFNVEELLEDLEDKLDIYKQSKLIEKLNSNGVPIFAHKSLAEFLVAQVILQIASSSKRSMIQNIVHSLFYQELETVRLFFDIMTLKGSALQSIITNHSKEHSVNEFDSNLVDRFKRNALHIAASYGSRCELQTFESVWPGVKVFESYNRFNSETLYPGQEFKRRTIVSSELFRKILKQVLSFEHKDVLFNFDVFDFAFRSGSLDMVEVLYSKNFKKYLQGINKDIFLYHVVKNGYFNIYNNMENINLAIKISQSKNNLLHVALSAESYPIVFMLTEKLKNIDEPNAEGHTPLISWLSSSTTNIAKFNKNQLKILKHLIKCGVKINSTNDLGETPLHLFSRCENKLVLEILIKNGADINKATNEGNIPLHYAVRHSIENVKMLLDNRSEIGIPNKRGYTPLCYAAQKNLQEIAELLISKGALINRGKNEINPLNAAIACGNVECAEFLINNGVKIVDDKDFNTLGIAVQSGHLNCVIMLVQKGAIIFEELLDFAVQNNHTYVIKYLLKNNRDVFKDLKTPLSTAVNMNDINTVKLLAYNASINAADEETGDTSLHIACILGLREIIKYLINLGAKINVKNKSGITPLFATAIYGHLDCIMVIIDKIGSDLHRYGSDIVYLAAREGHDQIIDYITSLQVDINQRNSEGFAPVHNAVKQNNLKCLKNLLRKGADINLKTLDDGLTPLMIAATEGFQNIVEHLVGNGAELNEEDSKYRQTALTIASMVGHMGCVRYLIAEGSNVQKYGSLALYNAAAQGNFDIMDHLLSVGVDINGALDGDCAAIHTAIYSNNLKAVKCLLEKEADVDLKTLLNKFTPLMVAVRQGHQDIAKCLIEHHANMDEEYDKNSSALTLAAMHGQLKCVNNGADIIKYGLYAMCMALGHEHLEIVEYLLSNNININQATQNDVLPINAAVSTSKLDIVQFVIRHGATIHTKSPNEGTTPLMVAAFYGCYEIGIFLLDNNVYVNEEDCSGFTALEHASVQGDLEFVTLLVDKGKCDVSKYGPQAIYMAATIGHNDIIEYLVLSGANINNIILNEKCTPLHLAVAYDNLSVVQCLLIEGADINSKSIPDQRTPLIVAAENGRKDIVEYLIEKGAAVDEEDANGDTALTKASSNGHMECVRSLINTNSNLTKYGPLAIRAATLNDHMAIVELLTSVCDQINTR